MSVKKWIVADADKEKASQISEKLNIDPFIAFLLVSRGIDSELAVSSFLSSSCEITSPFSLKDMDKAVDRINKALDSNEKICIYGDYDCDGVSATALLYSFFESMGADVMYYIPDRLADGYGINNAAVDYIKSQGTDLIITVDNGITAIDEAEYIYSSGMQLIITDHHQLAASLPRAQAVINPHRPDNDIEFRELAGVGVAFKLACAIYGGDIDELLEQYADLVAIGTIGDMVSLKSENRSLVKYGIDLINRESRIGIAALKKAAGSDGELTAIDIAYQLCPRINAAGRMDNAGVALELLICDDYEQADFISQQLNTENAHRHEIEENIIKSIKSRINKEPSLVDDRVIVIEGSGYHNGVIGIVASRISAQYAKPAIIIGIDENNKCTGSARSIEGFNIFDAISSCADILTHFGGHPLAAGLGIEKSDISIFRKRINDFAKKNYRIMPVETLKLDCKLSPFYLNTDLVDSLSRLEPYGTDNPQPVFGLFNVVLVGVTPISDGRHIRIEVLKKGKTIKIVCFKTTVNDFPYKKGDRLDFAVKLSKNLFKGKYYLSVKSIGVRRHGIDYDRYFSERSDLELFMLGNNPETQLYPDRNICGIVYHFLKRNNGWQYSITDLYTALEQNVTFGQLHYALSAFEQAGLIKRNGKIALNKISGKVRLEDTQILKTLKGRLNIE